MDDLKLQCPRCKHKFTADDALKNHLKSQEKDIEKEVKKREVELQKKIQKELEEKQENLKSEIETQLKEQIKDDLYKEKETAIKKLQKDFENQRLKDEKEMMIQNKRLAQRVAEMEKQLSQKSMEIQGEVQEELLQDFLKRKFMGDRIEEIKKGAKGGDCILTINTSSKKNVGQIYFESKSTKDFKEEWIDKFLKDMQNKDIGIGILVTEALPKNFENDEGFQPRHGGKILIIPFDYSLIHTVVDSIRSKIIDGAKSEVSVDIPRTMQNLYDHITGNAFQLSVRTFHQNIKKMEKLIEKEKSFMEKNIADREMRLEEMKADFRDMLLGFTRQVGDALPDNLLEYDD